MESAVVLAFVFFRTFTRAAIIINLPLEALRWLISPAGEEALTEIIETIRQSWIT